MAFPKVENLKYYRGDTFEFNLEVRNQDGTDFDLTEYEDVIFKIANKRGAGATQYTGVATKAGLSTIACTIPSNIGRDLVGGDYFYDVQIVDAGTTYVPNKNITFYAQWTANTVGTTGGTADVLPDIAPVISSATITGTAKVGQVLTANANGLTGSPTPTLSYQWKAAGTNVGTNSPTYTIVSGDLTKAITVVITATNGVGTDATATSSATSAVAAADAPTPIPAGQYRVTWDANGGTGGTSTTKVIGLSHTAPVVTRSGYTFSKWRNPATGGTAIFLDPSEVPDKIYTVLTGILSVTDDVSGAV
jgi:hypothetical protein